MYCSKCGAKIEDDSVFCHSCGAKVAVVTNNVNTNTNTTVDEKDKQADAIASFLFNGWVIITVGFWLLACIVAIFC